MPTDDRPRDHLAAAEASLDRLRRAGWSITEYTIRFVRPPALVHLIVGEVGTARLLVSGSTRDQAAQRACMQAEAIGVLALVDDAG
jgi:hypothetical protein